MSGGWVTIASSLTRRGPGGALSGYTSGSLRTSLTYDLAGTLMSRIVKDGTTVVFQREIPSTCGGGSASCLDANGRSLRSTGTSGGRSERRD